MLESRSENPGIASTVNEHQYISTTTTITCSRFIPVLWRHDWRLMQKIRNNPG